MNCNTGLINSAQTCRELYTGHKNFIFLEKIYIWKNIQIQILDFRHSEYCFNIQIYQVLHLDAQNIKLGSVERVSLLSFTVSNVEAFLNFSFSTLCDNRVQTAWKK
jgi:hypothetical protein